MIGYPKAYGRYVLEDRIAMGGMAEIFRARTATAGFEKRVCIKRILPHFLEDEEFVTMFRDEARTAAKLQHANVVQVFDFGMEEGALYLAMELVDGADLRRILEASRKNRIPFEVGEAVQIAIDMCKGLHHAHTLLENGRPLGLVHRDVSPHNVLVSRAGEVKITDFGIAKAAERATHTSAGIVKGKVAYMAPEQAQGFPFDHRLDQFAAGILLWEMLTGTRLFWGDSDLVILKKVITCDIPAPSALRKDVPAALSEIVLKALAPQPDDRFADMRQMELALSRFLFSGLIDQCTAEVRNVFARIMIDADPSLRKTQTADAASLLLAPSAVTPFDPPPVSKTQSQPNVDSAPSSDISMVFSSSERHAPSPGPRAVSSALALAPGIEANLDPNAVTIMEVNDGNLDSPMARAWSAAELRGPRALVPTGTGLPSVAELSRLDDASAALMPAPDATPATRTNIPHDPAVPATPSGAIAHAPAPPALPAFGTSTSTGISLEAVAAIAPVTRVVAVPAPNAVNDGINALALPRSLAPMAAAAVVTIVLGALAVRFFSGAELATSPPIEVTSVAAAPVTPPALPETKPDAPSQPPRAQPPQEPSVRGAPPAAEQPRAVEVPAAPAEAEAAIGGKPVSKKSQRVQVLVKATGRWVYFVSPTGDKIEIYSGGTPMKLPEGKGRFRLVTQEGKSVYVPLDVTAGKTLLLPAL